MGTGILVGLPTKWDGLHHGDQASLQLEVCLSSVDSGPGRHVVSRGSGKLTERLLGHLLDTWMCGADWFLFRQENLGNHDTGSDSP